MIVSITREKQGAEPPCSHGLKGFQHRIGCGTVDPADPVREEPLLFFVASGIEKSLTEMGVHPHIRRGIFAATSFKQLQRREG